MASKDSTYMHKYFKVQICSYLLSSWKQDLGFLLKLVNVQKYTWMGQIMGQRRYYIKVLSYFIR